MFVVIGQQARLRDAAVQPAAYVNLQAQARGDGSLTPVSISGAGLLAITVDLPGDGPQIWTVRSAQSEFHGASVSRGGTLAIVLDARRLDPGDYVVAVRPEGSNTLPERLYQFQLQRQQQ